MKLLRVAVSASVIIAGLMGCASSHTQPRHSYGYPRHAYSGALSHHHSYSHATGHHRSWSYGHHHGARHSYPRKYYRPAPVPGRTPDGRYVLPGGLESVCAGGTPPPCR